MCQSIAGKKAFVDSENNDGYTALMCAAKNGHADCVEALLQPGKASVDIKKNMLCWC